jgi:hypothetical protein
MLIGVVAFLGHRSKWYRPLISRVMPALEGCTKKWAHKVKPAAMFLSAKSKMYRKGVEKGSRVAAES